MSMIHYPGEPIEAFVGDFVMEVQPPGTREHGSPRRMPDGRVYLNDQRPGSPWAAHHDARGRWVCCYARPTERLEQFLNMVHGKPHLVDGSLEVIPWEPSEWFPKGATLLVARPGGEMRFISRYMVALEVPDYAGFKSGDPVSARWWDGHHHDAEVVGLNAGGRDRGYRCRFPHAQEQGRYVDVKPEDIRPRGTDGTDAPGRPDGDPQGDRV